MIRAIGKELLRGARARRKVNGGVRILTYHGVIERRVDPKVDANFHLLSDFRAHIEVLRRCNVIPLESLDETIGERSIRPRVAVTFDDGFKNNLTAAELLSAARIPATVFVSTTNVTSGEPIWPSLLRLVLARGSARVVELAGRRYDLASDESFSQVRKLFKVAPAAERSLRWQELVAQLGQGEVEELVADFPSLAMMTWAEVSSIQSSGFSIGSHGQLHELHHENQPRSVRIDELVSSKAAVERATSGRCDLFAFPNGSFTTTSSDEVRECGYRYGFSMVSRAARADDDPMLLPRLMPGPGPEKVAASIVFGN